MNGWIKLHRKLIDWEWYSDINTRLTFIHLLLIAAHKETVIKGRKIYPGQAIVGRKKLAEDIGISERSLRTSISHLISTNEVTIKSTNKFSVVTIENWAKYQADIDENDQQNDQQNVTQPTNKTSDNRPHTRNKEYKNNKRVVFTAPTIEEVAEYCRTRNNGIDPQRFIDYYAQQGWKLSNGNSMKDWKAAVRNWESRDRQNNPQRETGPTRTQEEMAAEVARQNGMTLEEWQGIYG